jgi:hypothetical protein
VAAPVYSSQLLQARLPDNTTATEVVPAGVIWVVRDISGVIFPGPNSGTNVEVDADSTAIFTQEAPPGCSIPFHWEGRVVLAAGQALVASNQFGVLSTEVQLIISGYVLTLP